MFGTLWECAGIIFPDTKFSNHGLFSLEKKKVLLNDGEY